MKDTLVTNNKVKKCIERCRSGVQTTELHEFVAEFVFPAAGENVGLQRNLPCFPALCMFAMEFKPRGETAA